jgi:hypothetical protein
MLYVVHRCRSAKQLLNAISLSGSRFFSSGKYTWLFRGQPVLAPLVPAAWRAHAIDAFNGGCPPATYSELIAIEARIAARFFRLADARGLPLPEDTEAIRRELYLHPPVPEAVDWPPHHWHFLLALARHYELPVRFLDWTWNPRVAAYFAASRAHARLRTEDKATVDDLLAVYALSITACDVETLRNHSPVALPGGRIEVVTAPAAGNENLRAQEGVFTHLVPPLGEAKPIPSMSVDGYVGALACEGLQPLLHAFTLPAGHASHLLYLLSADGVSASSVWPGYRGVALEIDELVMHESAPADWMKQRISHREKQ